MLLVAKETGSYKPQHYVSAITYLPHKIDDRVDPPHSVTEAEHHNNEEGGDSSGQLLPRNGPQTLVITHTLILLTVTRQKLKQTLTFRKK